MHIVAASVAAFIVIILFNPFHLTNLTHTFVISVSKHAERWRDVYEWRPAFDWTNPVGTAKPFLVMYIVAWVVLVIWGLTHILAHRFAKVTRAKASRKIDENGFHMPYIDLPLLMIAVFTIYMAIRSRRFIPIAAYVTCPFLAVFLQQVLQFSYSLIDKARHHRLTEGGFPVVWQRSLIAIVAVPVMVFGIWVGKRYKSVYLDPWPNDPVFSSVFMRMTASFQKPFYAGRFLKLNKLSGRMLNYWTEGGFIAYAQEPDPQTGKIPLQLYMDGRAQAAYDRKSFDQWSFVWGGGKYGATAQMRNRKLSQQGLTKMGQEIQDILKQDDVWVVLVPALQFRSAVIEGLEANPNWMVAFINNKQKLLVDYSSDKGRRLIQGIPSGRTLFPDAFSTHLNMGHFLLQYDPRPEAKQEGLEHVIKAVELNPSPMPMNILMRASQYPEFRDQITSFCRTFTKEFEEKEAEILKQDGARWRYATAAIACNYLKEIAKRNNDIEEEKHYALKHREYMLRRDSVSEGKRW
jgi:hypothetical protein